MSEATKFQVGDPVVVHDPDYGDFAGVVTDVTATFGVQVTGPRIDSRSWQWLVDNDRADEYISLQEA